LQGLHRQQAGQNGRQSFCIFHIDPPVFPSPGGIRRKGELRIPSGISASIRICIFSEICAGIAVFLLHPVQIFDFIIAPESGKHNDDFYKQLELFCTV
jgi:hypothetical protein